MSAGDARPDPAAARGLRIASLRARAAVAGPRAGGGTLTQGLPQKADFHTLASAPCPSISNSAAAELCIARCDAAAVREVNTPRPHGNTPFS